MSLLYEGFRSLNESVSTLRDFSNVTSCGNPLELSQTKHIHLRKTHIPVDEWDMVRDNIMEVGTNLYQAMVQVQAEQELENHDEQ